MEDYTDPDYMRAVTAEEHQRRAEHEGTEVYEGDEGEDHDDDPRERTAARKSAETRGFRELELVAGYANTIEFLESIANHDRQLILRELVEKPLSLTEIAERIFKSDIMSLSKKERRAFLEKKLKIVSYHVKKLVTAELVSLQRADDPNKPALKICKTRFPGLIIKLPFSDKEASSYGVPLSRVPEVTKGGALDQLSEASWSDIEKMKEAGYYTVSSVAASIPERLAEVFGARNGDLTKARKLIIEARKHEGFDAPQTAKQLLDNRTSSTRLSSGSTRFDHALGGGIEARTMTILLGEQGHGRTQMCHQLVLEAARTGKKALYIDCENSFRPERIRQIAGDEADAILQSILHIEAYNSEHLERIVETAIMKDVKAPAFGLVVIDDFTTHYRTEYADLKMEREKKDKLQRSLAKLNQVSRIFSIPVVITSRVTQGRDFWIGSRAFEGMKDTEEVTATRIRLRQQGVAPVFTATILSGPYPPTEVAFRIDEKGVSDLEK